MEVPLTEETSIIVKQSQLNTIGSRLGAQPQAVVYTLTKYLRSVYKRVCVRGETLQRLNPWHVEAVLLLSHNGAQIPPETLQQAIAHRKREQKENQEIRSRIGTVKDFLVASLEVHTKVQLASLVRSSLLHTKEEQRAYKRLIELCADSLDSGLIDATTSSDAQRIKRMVWTVLGESASISTDAPLQESRERLKTRCRVAAKMLANSLGEAASHTEESTAPEPAQRRVAVNRRPTTPDSHESASTDDDGSDPAPPESQE